MPNPNKNTNVEFNSSFSGGRRKVKSKAPYFTIIGGLFAILGGSVSLKDRYDAKKVVKKIKDINPYEYNKYDEDVKGFIRERADKAVDRKEPFDYVDELNRAQEYKNEHDRVPDPILRNPKKKYEDYKPINKKNDF